MKRHKYFHVDHDKNLVIEYPTYFPESVRISIMSKGYWSDNLESSGSYKVDEFIRYKGIVVPLRWWFFYHGACFSDSSLLHKLTKPNNMVLTQTYEATRDLLIGMAYHRGSTLVAQRTYTYDILGRPTARNTARNGQTVNDTFTHNNRSELTSATQEWT